MKLAGASRRFENGRCFRAWSSTLPFSALRGYATGMPSKIERAWVAGMIDADGCVTMCKSGPSSYRRPIVVVDNTDHEILDELQRLYGGSLVKKRRDKEHHRQCWSWRLYGANIVLAFLKEIVPFMHCKVKRDRAQLLLKSYKALTPRNGCYTDADRKRKDAFEIKFMGTGAGRGSQTRTYWRVI